MIKQLIPILRENGWDVSLEDILDLLWLAENLPPNQHDFSERADLPKLNGQTPKIPPATPKDETLLPEAEFIVDGKTIRSNVSGGRGLISPDAATLPLDFKGKKHSHSTIEKLGISRSLWPLRMLALKQKGNELDEAITSENIADALSYQIDTWIPEFLLERISWFDLIVIIDVATSMLLWKRTTDEFRQLLEHYGNFRNKHLLYVNSDLQGDLFLNYSADPSIIKKTHLSRINAEAGRTSVIVVTDCVGKAWRDGRLPDYLSTHGKKFQTTIAQVLPAHLWGLTALKKAERIYLSPVFPGQPNHQIMSRDNRSNLILKSLKRSKSIPFPCISMTDYSVAAWAKMLAGMPGQVIPGFSFAAPNDDSDKPIKEALNEFTVLVTPNDETDKPVEEVVNEFYAHTTPSAVRLARYLAFSNGSFDIQLVEAMMHEFFIDSDRSIAFEVLLSHLIKIELVDKAISFRFREGTQDFLLYGVTQSEAEDVARVLFALADRDGNNSIDLSKVTGIGAEISKEQLDSIWNVIRFLNNHRARVSKLVSSLNIKDSDRSKYFSWAEDSWNKGEWDNARSKYRFFLSQYDTGTQPKFIQDRLKILDRVQELSEKIDRFLLDLKPEQANELFAAMTELWDLASRNPYVREQDRKVQKITQQLRKTGTNAGTFSDLLQQWRNSSYREVLAQLGGLADKRNPRQSEAKRLERWLSDLVDKTRRAEMAYNENNLEEARSHIDAALQIPSIDEWRDTYTPLQDLLSNDDLKVEETLPDEDLKGSGFGKPLILDDGEGDVETKKTQRKREFLLDSNLPLDEELRQIDDLLNAGDEEDLKGQSLSIRKLTAQADYQRKLGMAEDAYKLYVEARQALQRETKGNSSELRERISLGIQTVWEQVSQAQLEGIEQLVVSGNLEEALAACMELEGIRSDPKIDVLRKRILDAQEKTRVGKITLGEVERALDEGDLSRAEEYLGREEVRNLPDADKVAQRVKKRREEVDTLFRKAEELEKQLDFSKVEAIYYQILKQDKTNQNATNKTIRVKANIARLNKIDILIREAQQAFELRTVNYATKYYGEAREYDIYDWRKGELDALRKKIAELTAEFQVQFDTFHEDIEKGKYKWPEEFENFLSETYAILNLPKDEIARRIEGEFPKYLQQHYQFLGRVIGNLSRMGLQKELESLQEIQNHWQPYLDDKSRLGKHTSDTLLDNVYKRVQNVVTLIPTYEQAAELLKDIDTIKKKADTALKQGSGHLEAVQDIEACLQSAPPKTEPVMDLIGDKYDQLKDLLRTLRGSYQANSSSNLLDVEMLLKIGRYSDAKKRLGNFEALDQLDPMAHAQWETLNYDTQVCLQMQEVFQKAKKDWNSGEWKKAQEGFAEAVGKVGALKSSFFQQPNEFALTTDKKNAQRYLTILEDPNFINLVQRLIDFSKKAITQENQEELGWLLQEPLLLRARVENKLLDQLFQKLNKRLTGYLRFKELLFNYELDRAQKELGKRIENSEDQAYLRDVMRRYKRAEGDMEKISAKLKLADESDNFDTILNHVKTCLNAVGKVAELKIRSGSPQEAQYLAGQIAFWQKELEKASEAHRQARRNKDMRNYKIARDQMQDALVNVPQRFTALRTKLEGELDQLNRLTLVEEPYKVKVDEAETQLKGVVNHTILIKVRKLIQEAGKTLREAPSGLDSSKLDAVQKTWVKKLEEELIKAWAAEDHALVGDLLELGKDEESTIVKEYARLTSLQTERKVLETAIRNGHIQEAERAHRAFSGHVNTRNTNENKESGLWENRIAALRAVTKAEKLASSTEPDLDAMEACVSDLETKVRDYWPDQKMGEEVLTNLRYQCMLLRASGSEEKGNVEQALQELGNALELRQEPGVLRKRDALQELIAIHKKAVSARNAGKYEEAVEYLKQCQSKRVTDFVVSGISLEDFQKGLFKQIEQKYNDARKLNAYVDALAYSEMLRRIEFNDMRYETLREELRQRLEELRKRYNEIAVNRVRVEIVDIERLLEDLEPVQSRWGLSDTETGWIPSVQSELSKWRLEIEELENRIARAWELLREAKAGNDESKFFAVSDEFLRFRDYEDREDVRRILNEFDVTIRAFREISSALEDFRSTQDRRMNAQTKLARVIQELDPKRELYISHLAMQELQNGN